MSDDPNIEEISPRDTDRSEESPSGLGSPHSSNQRQVENPPETAPISQDTDGNITNRAECGAVSGDAPPAASELSTTPSAAQPKLSTEEARKAISVYDIPAKELRDRLDKRLRVDLDAYDEDEAEQRFLHTKPACFIVLGKPGCGKSTLAKKLSEDWHCEFINPTELIKHNISERTVLGQTAEAALLKGDQVNDAIIFRMLSEKMNSEEVSHLGYVLDGFPSGSSSDAPADVRAQLDLLQSFKFQPDFAIHIRIPDADLQQRLQNQRVDPQTGELFIKEMYTPTPLPPPPEPSPIVDDAAAKLYGPEGLTGGTKKVEEEEEPEAEEPEEDEDEDGKPKEAATEYPEMDPEVVKRLITRIEDLPENVQQSLSKYKVEAHDLIMDYLRGHDRQRVIELDGNEKCDTLFSQLIAWLETFVVSRGIVPKTFTAMEELFGAGTAGAGSGAPGSAGGESGGAAAAEDAAAVPEVETEDLFRSLANTNPVAPRWRWRRSRWLRYCPVSLFDGDLAEGKPNMAVSFLDKIYVMSSLEALKKFIRNPRPYLMSPMPRPTCKMLIVGPKQSGRSTLAKLLAHRYGGKVIDMSAVMQPLTEAANEARLKAAKIEAKSHAIQIVKQRQADARAEFDARKAQKEAAERRRAEAERQRREIEEAEAAAAADAEAAAKEGAAAGEGTNEGEGESGAEVEKAPEGATDGEKKENEPEKAPNSDEELERQLREEAEEKGADEEGESPHAPGGVSVGGTRPETVAETPGEAAEGAEVEELEENSELDSPELLEFLEANIDESYPEVAAIIEAAMAQAKDQEFRLPLSAWLDELERQVRQAEKERRERMAGPEIHGGWVLDNFPNSPDEFAEFLKVAVERKCMPDDILVLRDQSDNQLGLIKRWYNLNREQIDASINERVERARKEREEREREQREREEAEARKKAEEEAAKRREQEENEAAAIAAEEEENTLLAQMGMAKDKPFEKEATQASRDGDEGKDVEEAEPEGEAELAAETAEAAGAGGESTTGDALTTTVAPTGLTGTIEEEPEAEAAAEAEPERFVLPELPPEGPELEALKNRLKEFDLNWAIIATTISAVNILPTEIGVDSIDPDQMLQFATRAIEKKFEYTSWAMSGEDLNDEEEDTTAEKSAEADELAAMREEEGKEEEEEEQAEESEKDANRSKKKHLGDVNWICPVMLKEKGVMFPGNPEISAKYREKIYYVCNYDARERFIANPSSYLTSYPLVLPYQPDINPNDPLLAGAGGGGGVPPAAPAILVASNTAKPLPGETPLLALLQDRSYNAVRTPAAPPKPPARRILIIGPKGAGKSTHGKYLAEKLGMYHLSFRQKLQEIIMPKVRRKIGPEFREAFQFEEEMKDLQGKEKERQEQVAQAEAAAAAERASREADEARARGEEPPAPPPPPPPPTEANPAATPSAPGEPPKEGQPEEPEPELTPNEKAILDYLESDIALPTEVLDEVLPLLWLKEPYLSAGVILEGFPSTVDEVRYLIDPQAQPTSPGGGGTLFPDACISLNIEAQDVTGRLLPDRLESWRERRRRKKDFREAIKASIKTKRDEAMERRRQELIKEKEREKQHKADQRAAERFGTGEEGEEAAEEEEEEEDDEEATKAEIEDQLATEFEEVEEEDQEEESEEDATDRIRNEINDQYDNDVNRIATITQQLEELLVTVVQVNAGRRPHITKYQILKKLKPLLEWRNSAFERVYSVMPSVAERMLRAGYCRLSRFGRWDPVELADGKGTGTGSGSVSSVGAWGSKSPRKDKEERKENTGELPSTRLPVPPYGKGKPLFPAIYRTYVYFFGSEKTRQDFSLNVLHYLEQTSPKPVLPVRIAIIGPPKAGKTTLASRLGAEYGALRASAGEAMRYVLRQQKRTALAQQMTEFLARGLTVPDELAVQSLDVYLLNTRCRTRGYILDGYPVTPRQLRLLTEAGIVPTRVYEMQITPEEVLLRGTQDRAGTIRAVPLPDSAALLQLRRDAFEEQVGKQGSKQGEIGLREWCTREARNYAKVDGAIGKWRLFEELSQNLKTAMLAVEEYLGRIEHAGAAPIDQLCLTSGELRARLGEYGFYCPVRLQDQGELVDNEAMAAKDLSSAAEYRGRYYVCATRADLAKFLEHPEMYTPPLAARSLPVDRALLPRRVKMTDSDVAQLAFPKQVEFHGYCPVTFLDGRSKYEAIVQGRQDCIVRYNNKLFCFESDEKLEKFMRLPAKYSSIKLPNKLPPPREPLSIGRLPLLGFLEQSLADTMIVALTSLGNLKPKYPYMHASRAACVYLALHLKAHNPKSPQYVRDKYAKKQREFEETCGLARFLGRRMTLKYKPQSEDIDKRLTLFARCSAIDDSADFWAM